MQNILRIDMGGAGGPTASLEPDGRYAGLAGRAMTSLVVAEEVDPACHPLGGGNKIVLAPGRTRAPTAPAAGVSVACKSPLTGGIVTSGGEGPVAEALGRLGYAAVVVEGQPPRDDLWTILVDERGVAFATENGYRMLGNLETIAKLRHAHRAGAALLTIGPAGEMALGAASLACAAGGLRPVRHCGRGGVGAVMGSKRVKAIVVDGGPSALAEGREDVPAEGDPDARVAASPYREACGIRDPLVLDQLAALEDDLGLEGAEVAGAVSLAMEAGLARLGDGQAALRLVEEIARWTPLGRIVGSGLRAMAEAFGLEPRVARFRLEAAPAGPAALRAVAAAWAELGDSAQEVVAAERRFLARARAAAADDGEPGAWHHPIVFGVVDDDVARLFGALDPDADPFDPQLQLPVGLRAHQPSAPGGAARILRPPGKGSHRN